MILVIDNYDSFTYNLVQYLGELGAEVSVFRNDSISAGEINALNPDRIVISPGPGNPSQAGISKQVILEWGSRVPILGVCLGHQCIAEVFGGKVIQANNLMHGKVSLIYHSDDELFSGISSPFVATRYHSLIVQEPIPDALVVTAFTQQNEIMGLRHRVYPLHGIQFHPESILSPAGRQILSNFLAIGN
jgi:anthranilate synthase/aminodeoxychorismate synthase-like glutamine amidotransferase